MNADIDGDGKVDAWETKVCRYCLIAILILIIGDASIAELM